MARFSAVRLRFGVRRAVGALVVGALLGIPLTSAPPASNVEATSIVPFAPVFSANDNGSIAAFGNNLMVCPASAGDCAAARAGTNTRNNNNFNMVHLDVDTDATTFSSSSADVVLPDDAEVRWAGLYWGARLGAGRGGVNATGDGRQMKLRAPGDTAYRTITAGRLFGPTTTADRAYQGFADVTSILQAAGPGTYFGADVPAATGEDRHAGWSLVIVYRSPSLPLRNLTVNDGLADVGRSDPQIITISGFRTPVTGPVNARIGLVAYEGDNGSTGDRAILSDASNPDGTLLATTLSQGTNFFNGANDDNGTLVTARNPADRNMLGFDIKNFDGPGILGNSSTSAQIDLASTSERYFPGVVTTAIDLFAPDFSPSTKTVTNLSGGTPARVGDRLRYTVTFVNAGQDPAINTSIVDPIPPGTSYVPGSLDVPTGVTGTFDSAANAVRVSPGDFAIGRSVEFTFDVIVGAAAANTEVANQATITYDGATVPELQDLTFSTRAASIAVVPSSDLVVTKVNTPNPVVAGQPLTSTITVRNAGPSPAENVVVADELPAGLTNVSATATAGTCTVAAADVSCTLGTVAPSAVVTITVTATVPPDSTAATLTDVARVTSDTADPDPDDNTAPASSEVTRNADLSVTKTMSPATVAPGGEVTYTVVATNNGPSTATNVAVTDTVVDPGIELTSATAPGATCALQPLTARCNVPSLVPGASVTMTVIARVGPDAAPGSLNNAATATSATPDGNSGNNQASSPVTVGPPVSLLSVTKSASPAGPFLAGLGEVRYTVAVVNTGPSDAATVTAGDTLPAGFTVVAATSDRGGCTITPAPTGDTVSCEVGPLAAPFGGLPGAQATITIVAQVPADTAAGTYTNTATAQAPGSPPADSDPVAVEVTAQADLSIVKSFPEGSDSSITPGEPVTYRIRVANNGPSVATNVDVTDLLPAGLTASAWRSDSAGAVCDVVTVTCDLGDLPPGTTVELELDVPVPAGYVIPADGVANTASVTTVTFDPNDADNTSTFTVGGAPQADLSIRKLPPSPEREILPVPAPVAGENTSYILEVTNFGPSVAPNMVITDVLPPGVSFVRTFAPTGPPVPADLCTGDGGDPETVTCTFPGNFPAFVGTHIGIEVAIDPTVRDGTVLSNTATITSGADDNNPGNNTSTATVPARAVANLRTIKRVFEVDPATMAIVREVPESEVLSLPAGYPLQFQLDVVNDGPSAASDVSLIDNFEALAGVGLIGVNCEIRAAELFCPYTNAATGDLLLPYDGTAATLFAVPLLTVPISNTAEGTYTNTMTVSTPTEETTLADNTDARDVEIIAPVADLIVDKAAVTSPLVAGETFTYEIEVTAGLLDFAAEPPVLRWSSDAQDVEVTDTLPAGLVPTGVTSTQGECALSGQDVSCQLGTITALTGPEAAAPARITVTGTVDPGITGTEVANTATATSSTPITGGVDSVSDSTTTPIERSADLAVTKAADSPTAAAGGGITFTVTVTNTGPSDATNVVLTDLLPAPLQFSTAGSDDECTVGATDVMCDVGTVPAGESIALTIAATLPSGAAPGTVTNTATVESDVEDPDGDNNSASVPVDVTQQADISVLKTPAAEGVLLGDTMTYTLLVANEGPSDATDVVLTESIPAGTVVATLPPGCEGEGPVTCTIGAIAAGDTVSLDLVLEVPDTLPPGPLVNTASVTSPISDPDLADNSSDATVEAVAQADVHLDKVLVTENPVAGQPVTFELRLINRGPTVAPNASFSDPIPTGATFVSFTATQGTCQLDEVEDVPAASCNLGRMEVGGTATATLVLMTDPNATTITNTGYSGSGGLDEIPEDNEDTATAFLSSAADLSITKSGPAAVSSAAPVEYVLEYANAGPSTATDVVITDTLPAGLTPRPLDGCTIEGTTVSCTVPSVAPDATGSITITADVDPALPLGTELTDTATIASTAAGFQDPDPANNSSSLTSTVDAMNDVGVTVTANQDEVPGGAEVSYTVVVTNNGPQLASAVVLTNELPPVLTEPALLGSGPNGIHVVMPRPMQVPPDCTLDGITATCQLGDLAVGETRSLLFGGTVPPGTPAGTELVDTATVTFDGEDAVEANNQDADTIVVIALIEQPTTTTAAPTTTTTSPSVTTAPSRGGPGRRGALPTVGAAIAGLVAAAALLVVSGGGLRAVAAIPGRRRRRQ